MSDSMFHQPSGQGDFFKCADRIDHLILFVKVHSTKMRYDELREEDSPIAQADVVDLSEPDAVLQKGMSIGDFYVAGKLIAGQEYVLGRIRQLPPKRAGWKGAIILDNFEDDDVVIAAKWVDAHKADKFQAPAETVGATAKSSGKGKVNANLDSALDVEIPF